MQKFIHTPQGRSTRLMQASLSYDIGGLYTNGFTSCNIIAVIGKEKIALVHADQKTSADMIANEVKWVGDPSDVVLIFREKWRKIVTSRLFSELTKLLPGKIITLKSMDDDHDGVLLSFSESPDNPLHRNIKKYPMHHSMDNLIRHPDEQRFTAVQKIEQIIGINAIRLTGKMPVKPTMIFDGRAWEPIDSKELTINEHHSRTKGEVKFLRAGDTLMSYAGRLLGILTSYKDAIASAETMEELSTTIAPYLEGYFNDFQALKLFKRALYQLIDEKDLNSIFSLEKRGSEQDNEIVKNLLTATKKADTSYESIDNLITTYKKEAPDTLFKKQLLVEYSNFNRHYKARMVYATHAVERQSWLTQATKYRERAIKHYQANEFPAAINLFHSELKLNTYSCLKDNQALASNYYNLGRCFFKTHQYKVGKILLENALILQENYCATNVGQVNKYQNALNECKNKIDDTKSPAIEGEMKTTPSS